MQVEENVSSSVQRNKRLSSLREKLREMPIIKQKSSQIQQQWELKQSLSEFTFDQSESFSTRNSEEQEMLLTNSFDEKYETLDKLGEGGNGCVYKCRHKLTNKIYAVKKFRVEQEHLVELKKRFILIKDLNHPCVVSTKALFMNKNQRMAYLVMEYLPFPSLDQVKIESEAQLKEIVSELLSGIAYIHNRNICHRDIKPQNILYDQKQKKIKIIDFGISKKIFQRGARRDILTIIGTHYYLAPEVYIGGGYDQKIDLWALGVTIFKIIAGYTPFESIYHSDTIANILEGEVSFDANIWKNYHQFARNFVGRLLKPKQQRMPLIEAQNHFWLQNSDKSKKKRIRLSSYSIQLNQNFHHQMKNNVRNALSKQQGCGSKDLQRRVFNSINLINQVNLGLQDSDGDDFNVKNTAASFRHAFKVKTVPNFGPPTFVDLEL